MSFSYNAVWEDTLKLLRQHGPLLIAIAGVFLFMPALLIAVFAPPPEPPPGADPGRAVQIVLDYYKAAWPWYLLQFLLTMVGTLGMLRLVFSSGTTVGDALVHALKLTPFYILLSVILGVAIGIALMLVIIPAALLGPLAIVVAFFLLVVPLLYLIGRIIPVPAVMVAENRRNPFAAIRRTFALTEGRGWAVVGIVAVVAIVGGIAVGVAVMLFGLVFTLAAGQALGKLLTAVVASALNAALATLLIMLYAAIYRALAGTASVAAPFE